MGSRTIAYMPLDEIAPADRNPKLHDVETTLASVRRFGYAEPVLLDERTQQLVAGHGRLEALHEYRALMAADVPDPETGLPLAVPDGIRADRNGWRVPVVRGWASASDAEAEAAAIAFNRGPERGGWNEALLAEMLSALDNLDGLGYDTADLDDLLAGLSERTVEFEATAREGEAHVEETYETWLDDYRNKAVRSIVLDYPLEEYERVVEAAATARAALGLDSTAALFARLVADAVAVDA